MRGLLLKDFYMICKHFKMYLVIDAVFIAVAFFSEDNIMFMTIPIMLAGVIPVTLLAYDERSHWTEYCGALPYSKAQIVSAKYITGLFSQLAVMIVIMTAMLVRNGISPYPDSDYLLLTVLAMFTVSLIFPTLCLPFCLKFGTEKGRIVYYIVIAAVASIAALLLKSTEAAVIIVASSTFVMPAVLITPTALYAASWVLSIILYNNKELGK